MGHGDMKIGKPCMSSRRHVQQSPQGGRETWSASNKTNLFANVGGPKHLPTFWWWLQPFTSSKTPPVQFSIQFNHLLKNMGLFITQSQQQVFRFGAWGWPFPSGGRNGSMEVLVNVDWTPLGASIKIGGQGVHGRHGGMRSPRDVPNTPFALRISPALG